MAHLNTLMGTLHPEEMGITAVREHIFWGPPGWELDPGAWFKIGKVFEKCYSDLMDFKLLGGQTFVDCSGIAWGRELDVYVKLAAATGMHVVASTWFWSDAGIAPHLRGKDTEYFEELFVRELTHGMGHTLVKAGVISAGSGSSGMSKLEASQYRAAARAARKTGAAVITHGVASALAQLDLFKEEGLDLSRVIIGGCDEAIDLDRDKRIAARGAYVAYDNVGVEAWSRMLYAMPDEKRAQLVRAMLDAGYRDRLIVSAGSKGWVVGRGETHLSNVGNVLRYFVPRLKDAGVAEEAIHAIFVDNPKRVLPIQ
jgi:predicted metal-dependent phosphotriesterase family hydrolase